MLPSTKLIRQLANSFLGGGESLPHACRCGRARNIVAGENRVQLQRAVEVLAELGTELAQFFERELLQLAALVEREAHRLSDGGVREPERHALGAEIARGGGGI